MGSHDPAHDDTLALAATTGDTQAGPADHLDLAHLPTGNERYERGILLGRGGMGEVLVARDAQIGREVALKRMRSRDEGSIARFLREARIQGRLDHPAIVPVHEVAVDAEGRPFFVMKRLTGTTLADILAARAHATPEASAGDKHPLSRLLRAFTDVCLAIEFAHTRGVIHRDLKPANIMLGDFGEVYVLDWGVAREVGDAAGDSLEPGPGARLPGATEAGAVLGTIGYMPPEQLRGLPVDRRADVYALGCILFEILAGAPLHAPGEYSAAFDPYDARPSVRAPQRDVPPELDALVVRATAPEPERRPPTARELADAVQRYLDGDRDIAQRRRLARDHVAQARAALVPAVTGGMTTTGLTREPPTEQQRRAVMQHAGRALALDPTAGDAAELIGRVMLEPPRDTPPEVEAELAAIDEQTLRTQARVAMYAYLLYLAFIPLMWWVGVTDPLYTALIAGGGLLNAGLAWVITRAKGALPDPLFWAIAIANIGMLFVMGRMFTPFLVAPGLACATMLAFAMHARFGRTNLLAAALAGGVLLPWAGEAAGWWPRTSAIVDGALVLRSAGGDFVLPNVELAHALYVTALVLVVGLLVRLMAATQRDARRTAHIHAWHLRHLMPAPAGA